MLISYKWLKNLSLGLALLCFCFGSVSSQPLRYPVTDILPSLLDNANSVIRLDQTEITIKDPQNANAYHHEVYTVLNQQAQDVLTLSIYNSKFRQLSDAKIRVYNKEGQQIGSYGKKDLSTNGYGEGLIEDDSYSYFKVSPPSYPITVEFEYWIKYKGILQYPSYVIQMPNQSVEKSSYRISVPTQLGFRFKNLNTQIQPLRDQKDGLSTFYWQTTNKIAVQLESSSGPKFQYLPAVIMAADHFSMDNYSGLMDSWDNFGKWVLRLSQNENGLTQQQIDFYRQLTAEARTPLQKARILYDYLQKNMRYVSIQLGIGGWKPLAASFVSDKKYGDCKALSHFMQAALAAVGIESYPALINMGRPDLPVDPQFPVNVFNHEVLCIPHLQGEKDTTWLECTSKLQDFGCLGYQTSNQYALLLKPTQPILVRTPAATASQNTLCIQQQIHFHADGSAEQKTSLVTTGAYKTLFLSAFYKKGNREQLKFMTDYLNIKAPTSFQTTEGEKTEHPFKVDLDLSYTQFPDFSTGGKLFLPSRPVPFYINSPNPDTDRKTAYYFSFPYELTDTTFIQLDEGLTPESIPNAVERKLEFGTYKAAYSYDEASRQLRITSHFGLKKDSIQASEFMQYVNFVKEVTRDLGEKLVIVREQ